MSLLEQAYALLNEAGKIADSVSLATGSSKLSPHCQADDLVEVATDLLTEVPFLDTDLRLFQLWYAEPWPHMRGVCQGRRMRSEAYRRLLSEALPNDRYKSRLYQTWMRSKPLDFFLEDTNA